jgi:hypothetical protein
MLLWMIHEGEVTPFFDEAKSTARSPAHRVIAEAIGYDVEPSEERRLIQESFEPAMAARLLAVGPMEDIEEAVAEWAVEEGARNVAACYFVFASRIDWRAGVVLAEIPRGMKTDRHPFWDGDELLNSNFADPDYHVVLRGLRFERAVIELLQPTAELVQGNEANAEPSIRRGRPRIWDWEGVTTHLLSIAQAPDGLPTGPGAQAQIERIVGEWFAVTSGNSPAASQIRQHASKIMKALEKPKNR